MSAELDFSHEGKRLWVTDQVMGSLIDALRDLLFPLATPGRKGVFDPREHLERLLGENTSTI